MRLFQTAEGLARRQSSCCVIGASFRLPINTVLTAAIPANKKSRHIVPAFSFVLAAIQATACDQNGRGAVLRATASYYPFLKNT